MRHDAGDGWLEGRGLRLGRHHWALGADLALAGGRILVWDRGGELQRRLCIGGGARFALSPDDRLAVVGRSGGSLWDLGSGQRLVVFAGFSELAGSVSHVAISPGGGIVAACGRGSLSSTDAADVRKWAILWDATSGAVLAETAEQHMPLELPRSSIAIGRTASMAD